LPQSDDHQLGEEEVMTSTAAPVPARQRTGAHVSGTSVGAGLLGAVLLGGFYAGVVGWAGGVDHLRTQAVADWPWLAAILAGFGTQIALFTELRHRRRLNRAVAATSGTGATASALGMVACCAHHIADLAPILGASGAAVFLTGYRVPIMAAGIAVNLLGVALAARRLHRLPLPARIGS
jgi:hypothetical protein